MNSSKSLDSIFMKSSIDGDDLQSGRIIDLQKGLVARTCTDNKPLSNCGVKQQIEFCLRKLICYETN